MRGSPAAPCRSGDNGPATDATLCTPVSVAVDHCNIYIYEQGSTLGDAAVRKITEDGRIHTIISGLTGSQNYDMGGIAVGPDGSLYIAEPDDSLVCRVTPDGQKTIFAGQPGQSG